MLGIFDKVLCEIPDKERGGLKKIIISRKKFENWVEQGRHVVELNGFKAYLFDPQGKVIAHDWVEGHELTRGEYAKLKDEDDNVYGLICSQNKNRKIKFLKKSEWKKACKKDHKDLKFLCDE